jgi:hypothetical protein
MGDPKAMTTGNDELERLQAWYGSECNGDWEHQSGIRIQTLDNPGWAVDIDLVDTVIEGRAFVDVVIDRSETDWIHCKVEGDVFKGRGGPGNLREILCVFLVHARGD